MILAPAGGGGAMAAAARGLGIMFLSAFALAWIGMFAALRIRRARGRPRTRAIAWLGAVLGASLAFAGFLAFGFSKMSNGKLAELPSRITTARDSMEEQLPPALERMAGGKEKLEAQRAMTRRFTDSPGFIWWFLIVGQLMGALIMGSIAGTAAWGVAMAVGRVVGGKWPLGELLVTSHESRLTSHESRVTSG